MPISSQQNITRKNPGTQMRTSLTSFKRKTLSQFLNSRRKKENSLQSRYAKLPLPLNLPEKLALWKFHFQKNMRNLPLYFQKKKHIDSLLQDHVIPKVGKVYPPHTQRTKSHRRLHKGKSTTRKNSPFKISPSSIIFLC